MKTKDLIKSFLQYLIFSIPIYSFYLNFTEEEELKSEVEETKTIEPAPSSTGDEEGSKAGVRIKEDENVSTISSDCPNKSTSYWDCQKQSDRISYSYPTNDLKLVKN